MFFIFTIACKKYKFNFSLNTHGDVTLLLKPMNNFENIGIRQEYYNRSYSKLFLRAIKAMRMYRLKEGY